MTSQFADNLGTTCMWSLHRPVGVYKNQADLAQGHPSARIAAFENIYPSENMAEEKSTLKHPEKTTCDGWVKTAAFQIC